MCQTFMSAESFFDICYYIVSIFGSDRYSDKIRRYAGSLKLFVGKLAMCSAGRMQNTCA